MVEPRGSEPRPPTAPAGDSPGAVPDSTWRPGLLAIVAALLGVAILSGAVAVGVTLGILRSQSRTNSQELNLGSRVSITEDSAAAQVAAKALPAVVSIVTEERGPTYGAGFVVTTDGYLVTSTQVVANASTLTVLVSSDPHRRDAHVVDFDCGTGLAVLKLDHASNLPTLSFADSAGLKLGQTVVALSGPLDSQRMTTRGVVSGLHSRMRVADPVSPARDIDYADTIQTDAAIASGSSGGPLLNVGGQVVGMSVAASSHGQVVGFALAANDLQPEVEQILQFGQLQVASLGASTTDLGIEEAALRGLPPGSLVDSVESDAPAAQAGIRPGDVITQLDEVHVDAAHPLAQVLHARYKPTQRVTVSLWRGGASSQVQLALRGQHPACA